jgi:hypothetical protein
MEESGGHMRADQPITDGSQGLVNLLELACQRLIGGDQRGELETKEGDSLAVGAQRTTGEEACDITPRRNAFQRRLSRHSLPVRSPRLSPVHGQGLQPNRLGAFLTRRRQKLDRYCVLHRRTVRVRPTHCPSRT